MSRIKNRKTRDYFSFLYQKAEEDVINSCFYCGRCKICGNFKFIGRNLEKIIFFIRKMLFVGRLHFEEKINISQLYQDLNFLF